MDFLNFFIFFSFLVISVNSKKKPSVKEQIEALENEILIDGDILPNFNDPLPDSTSLDNESNFYHAVRMKTAKWPNGLVYFKLDKSFDDDEINIIYNAMSLIEKKTCIRFIPHSYYYGPDYIKIIKGHGCFSNVGKAGKIQKLSLGQNCVNPGTVIHELLHSIGFFHHHMRSDRDKYLNIHYENIRNKYHSQFNKLAKWENRILTPFDYNSIMIYGEKAFSKNNNPTMTAKAKNVKLSYPFNKTNLSKYDIKSINKLYNCNVDQIPKKSSRKNKNPNKKISQNF